MYKYLSGRDEDKVLLRIMFFFEYIYSISHYIDSLTVGFLKFLCNNLVLC